LKPKEFCLMKQSSKLQSRIAHSLPIALTALFCIAAFTLPAASQTAATRVEVAIQDSTIPPGGMLQFQLRLTEPKPIGNSSTRPSIPTGPRGPVRGIALNDPLGVTAGVAVITNSGIRITTTSPTGTFGDGADKPILTIAAPIRPDSNVGNKYPMSINTVGSFWLDPSGKRYTETVHSGTLTIGGTMAISDVVPGGGQLPAGTHIKVLGMGFQSRSRVDISGVLLTSGDSHFVSSGEIDVVLPQALQIDGRRVRVRNSGGEVTTYYSYLRTNAVGESSHLLVSESYPLFARQALTRGTLAWKRGASTFTALAVQNPGAVATEVKLELLSAAGQVLGSFSFPLPAVSNLTRDLKELFPQPPNAATSVRIASLHPIMMLGLMGDDTSGNVVPVIIGQ
jgi:hypothetical protein